MIIGKTLKKKKENKMKEIRSFNNKLFDQIEGRIRKMSAPLKDDLTKILRLRRIGRDYC